MKAREAFVRRVKIHVEFDDDEALCRCSRFGCRVGLWLLGEP